MLYFQWCKHVLFNKFAYFVSQKKEFIIYLNVISALIVMYSNRMTIFFQIRRCLDTRKPTLCNLLICSCSQKSKVEGVS